MENLTGLQIAEATKANKTTPVFYTLQQLFTACAPHQLTLQDILNKQIYLGGGIGWTKIELDDELLQLIAEQTSEKLGGWAETKRRVKQVLQYNRVPQHWGLKRIILENYQDKYFLSYIAGQDYPSETAEIRTYLKKF